MGLWLLAGCAGTQQAPAPTVNMYQQQPLRVTVEQVEMMDMTNAVMPEAGWVDVSRQVQPVPAEWLKQWAKERLVPVGQDGSLRVIIHRASLEQLAEAEKKDGLDGWLYEPVSKLKLQWDVQMKLYRGESLNSVADVNVTVKEGIRMEASEPLEDAYMRLVVAAREKLEAESRRLIDQYMQ